MSLALEPETEHHAPAAGGINLVGAPGRTSG